MDPQTVVTPYTTPSRIWYLKLSMQCFVTPWCNNAIEQQSLIARVCCEAVRSAILATAWFLVRMWGHIADVITRVKY